MRLMLPEMHKEGNHNLGGPYGLLSGFALELGFKAAISAQGASDAVLFDVRHNLQLALRTALEGGLVISDEVGVRHLIKLMQPVHLNHLMRYIPSDVEIIKMPKPAFALEITTALLDDIERQSPQIAAAMPC